MNITVSNKAMADLLTDQKSIAFEYPQEKIWNSNGVSLKKRSTDSKFADKVEKSLNLVNLQQYVVPADIQAPTRCIDGRMLKGWDKSKKLQSRTLGPKIAGGTAHAALAHRIVDADNLSQDLLFEHDIDYVIKRYKSLGIGFGGHIDDHQHGWNTGCGAVDNINLILEKLQRPEPHQQLRGLCHLILGEAYNGRGTVNEVIGRMLYLDALKPRYMPKENGDPHGEFLYKKTIVKNIRNQAKTSEEAVPELVGAHNEIAIVLNFVHGTTLDNDRFSFDNDNELQLFGWDIWEMYAEADWLYSYNMYERQELQRQAIENRMRYITTRTLLGLATVMVLTDGSLKVITLQPWVGP